MLRRTALRVSRAAEPSLRRYASSGTPSRKICAAPFKVSWQDARDKLYYSGLLASGQTANAFYSIALKVFGMNLEPIGKELGLGENVEMRDMKAVYWPVWRFDMMAEGPWTPAHGGEECPAWLTVREAYIPGNPYAPMSYVSFSIPPLPDNLPQYNPGRDLRQLPDADIIPVDFTVNPFGVLEKGRDILRRGNGLEGMRINPDKWKETILAAYPIYFPVYIADFVHTQNDSKRSYQLIMDAHHKDANKCRVTAPPSPVMREMGRVPRNYFINPAPFMPTMTLIMAAAPDTPFDSQPPQQAMKGFSKWLSPEPSSSGSIQASPTLSVSRDMSIDWDDPRIQRWDSVERDQNGEYIDAAFDVHKNFAALRNMALARDTLPDDIDLSNVDWTMSAWENGKMRQDKGNLSDMQRAMEDSMQASVRDLARLKPEWLKRYQAKKADEAKKPAAGEEKGSGSGETDVKAQTQE